MRSLIPVVRRLWPMALALALSAFVLSFAPPGTIGPAWLDAAIAIAALAWVGVQPFDAERDDLLPALAVMLASFGLLLIARVSPDLAHKQQYWLLISLALVLCAGPLFTRFRRLAGYKYIWILGSFVLFLMLVIFGHEVNGARLWIQLGPIQLEPVELIKLFIVLFLAAYLAETADVIAAAKPWSIRSNLKYLGPLFIGWGASMAILVLQRDLGMATLLLATFAVLLYAATRRIDLVAGGFAVFGLAAYWAVHHYAYVQTRIDVWRNPFADALGAGYQSAQSYYALAAGGIFGTGYRLGHPTYIPDVATDYIYASLSEEFGLIGACVLLVLFLTVVRRIFAIGTQQPDLYTKLLAVGLAATLGVQVAIIVGGVVGLFPLTGITLPFVSYGGSSLVANTLLIGLVWAMSARPRPRPAA
ncbi:MAG TPA: FtsW/RodA/SpoVE family cell cycle protein [Candidatus Baltobacteraceae bacterium]